MKNKILIVLSIISTLTLIGWMISDFYGGMVIYLIMYSWIIVPLIIIYVITLLITLIRVIRNGAKKNKLLLYTHMFGILMIVSFNVYQSELFKSRILLDATLEDDLSNINLVLRENGHFTTTTTGMFGYYDRISCKYLKDNDTIIFLKSPYSNDFIPKKVLVVKQDSAIYFEKDTNGKFKREKIFANYFKIFKSDF